MSVYSRLYDKPKDSFANDISIFFTITPFTINEFVRPAALPKSSNFQISNGAKTMVSGFGRTEKPKMKEPFVAKKLKYAQISIRPSSYCESISRQKFDDKRFLCGIGKKIAQGAHRDACTNDSGGPLIAKVLDENQKGKFTLVGIVSHGAGIAESGPFEDCGTTGIYTKISKYLNFIHDPVHNY